MNKLIEESLGSRWNGVLSAEFDKPYFIKLSEFVDEEYSMQVCYPPKDKIFAAFQFNDFNDVRVVILGQDPYHGAGQANGLCFSVYSGVPQPPSLVNIFKELESDLGIEPPEHGDLSRWAKQGVLLLNATLTVRESQAGSHQKKGWETFTDSVIRELSNNRSNLVFLLWGGYAKKKGAKIDRNNHLVLTSGHPSPLSANQGYWFGNKHFSQTNDYLIEHDLVPIDW